MLFRSALSSLSRTSVLSRSLKSVITGEELHTGIVKAYDVCRGFGFIRPENNAADIFCHQSDIMGIGFRSLQGLSAWIVISQISQLSADKD